MRISDFAFDRAMKRAIVLRRLGVPYDAAGLIGLFFEYRIDQHERLGGEDIIIYPESGLDYDRWADLYRRTAKYLSEEHRARIRAVLDRLDLVVG